MRRELRFGWPVAQPVPVIVIIDTTSRCAGDFDVAGVFS